MGVSGCGKSHIAARVAQQCALPFIEGDSFHTDSSRALMARGIALTDADRAHWLTTLGDELRRHADGAVLSCSALRLAYRDQLRQARPGLRFAWLDLDIASARARVAARPGHFFPPGLVDTQFATLQSPLGEPGVLRVDALRPPQDIAADVARWLAAPA